MIEVLEGKVILVIVSVVGNVKLVNISEIKNISCKRCHFGELVLACEDKILNTTEMASIVDKKIAYNKKLPE